MQRVPICLVEFWLAGSILSTCSVKEFQALISLPQDFEIPHSYSLKRVQIIASLIL